RSERLALAVVAAAVTLPIVSVGAMLMTIDAPFTCAWTWALVFGQRAWRGGSLLAWRRPLLDAGDPGQVHDGPLDSVVCDVLGHDAGPASPSFSTRLLAHDRN